MSFIKRGLTSMFRKPGKTIILLVLIFILCNVIAGAASVKTAMNETRRTMLEKLGAEVRVIEDWKYIESLGEDFDYSLIKPLDMETVNSISESEYVKRSNYSVSYSLAGSDGLKSYVENPDDNITFEEEYAPMSYFELIGGSNDYLKAEEDGDINITEGRCYSMDEVNEGKRLALISEEVAELNGLSVGDTIKFMEEIYIFGFDEGTMKDSNGSSADVSQPKREFEFEIIGLFKAKPITYNEQDGAKAEAISPLVNSVYTTSGAVNSCIDEINQMYSESSSDGSDNGTVSGYIEVTFMLNSIDDLEVFEAESKPLLPMGYTFTDNSDSFSGVEKPMENMTLIADIILYVSTGATILIICLLVTLFLRDRKREMGIYLSLGERRVKIALQILFEVMTVAIVAVTLSIFSGNVLADKLSGSLLEGQLGLNSDDTVAVADIGYASDYRMSSYIDNGYISADDLMDEYSVSLSTGTVLYIYIIGLGSVLISTLIPIIGTLRLKPRSILM